ncbi:MAG: hypothetical protein H6837_02825 [Planctomycetes bacterium]|nr:hypothetical protein [Planctomycetota bacterium]
MHELRFNAHYAPQCLRAPVLRALAAVALLLATAVPGQAPRPAGVAAGTNLQRIHTDRAADGSIWVLAPGYKARFARDGIEYVPYFGPRARRNHPVHFRVARITRGGHSLECDRVAPPVLEGDRILFDRGAVREVWHLRSDGTEQTFVLDELRGEGDLLVEIDVRTELAARRATEGLVFAHPTLGEVRYGDVLAYDSGGRSARSATRLRAGRLELHVDEALLAAAEAPLTIDPLVRTIAIDRGKDQVTDADVAYEPTNDTWLVAYVRSFSTTDTDIISRRFDNRGNLLEELVVATGSRESARPSVAANGPAKQFLIAWDEDTGIADRVILGRLRSSGNTVQGQTFTILDSPGLGVDDLRPAVGGANVNDPNGNVYAVLCMTGGRNGRALVFSRVSTSGSVLQARLTLSPSNHDVVNLQIAKARQANGSWVCTYLRNVNGFGHVHLAEVPVTGSSFRRAPIDESGDCVLGGIAGRAPEFFAVYAKLVGPGNSDIFGRSLRVDPGSVLLRPAVNLTAVEPTGIPRRDQQAPVVSFDGARYTVVYQEDDGIFGLHDVYAMVVSIPGVVFSDGHRLLHAPSTVDNRFPAIAGAAEMGGPMARSMVVFERNSAGALSVEGALFDGFSPTGGISFVASKCGRVDLSALDEPLLGGTLRLRASRFDLNKQVFAIGLPSPPVQLCALGCKLGVAPILAVLPGVALDLAIPSDPGLLGATVAVQNALLGGSAGCQPPALAVETSHTMVIQVR